MRRVGVILVLALVASACGGDGGGTKATPGSGDKSEDAGVALRAPGQSWEVVELPGGVGPEVQFVRTVAAIDSGFLVAAADQAADEVVAWTSADGRSWRRSVVEEGAGGAGISVQGLTPRVAAARGDRVVLMGGLGRDCDLVFCGSVETVAWYSTDGGVTWARAEADPSFTDGAQLAPDAVLATDEGFVAVGTADGPSAADWHIYVWRSADGTKWELAAELSRPGPLTTTGAVATSSALAVTANEALCTEPFLNGNFWVLGAPFANRQRLWTSTDAGATWEERQVDKMAPFTGIPEPESPPCDDATAIGDFEHFLGLLHGAGDRFFVSRRDDTEESRTWSTADFEAFDQATTAPLSGINLPAGGANQIVAVDGGFLAVQALIESEEAYPATVWRSRDGLEWEVVNDAAELADPPPPRQDFVKDPIPLTLAGAAVNATTAVVAGTAARQGDLGDARVWVSSAS